MPMRAGIVETRMLTNENAFPTVLRNIDTEVARRALAFVRFCWHDGPASGFWQCEASPRTIS